MSKFQTVQICSPLQFWQFNELISNIFQQLLSKSTFFLMYKVRKSRGKVWCGHNQCVSFLNFCLKQTFIFFDNFQQILTFLFYYTATTRSFPDMELILMTGCRDMGNKQQKSPQNEGSFFFQKSGLVTFVPLWYSYRRICSVWHHTR